MPRDALTPEQQAEQAKYELLPTGKPHVSFSEVKDWHDCSWRHRLKYVQKVGMDLPGVNLDFGTSVHAACEDFLRTKVMKKNLFLSTLKGLWEEHAKLVPDDFTVEAFKRFGKEGTSILPDVPGFLDATFPGWEYVDAEHALYEPLDGHPHAFKGYIDCIIRAPGPKGKPLTWLLDWKTCSWGWSAEKKSDPLVRAQLVYYKNFWSTKTGTDPKDVRCGFVLLKRTAKPGNHCELVTTSVGDTTTGRSLQVINNMVASVKRGIAIKNRTSCTFCPYLNTEHCT
jgi:hypothetical protein